MERWATFDCYAPDRLERRHRARARASVRRGELPRLLLAYHEVDRASSASGRMRAPRGARRSRSTRSADGPAGERRTRSRARSRPGSRSPTSARARGRADARLEARDPLEHRPRLHRRLLRQSRPVRSSRSSLRDRLVQARPQALGGIRGQNRRRCDAHVHVGASLFHDIAPAIEPVCRTSGSTASARRPIRSPTSSCARFDRTRRGSGFARAWSARSSTADFRAVAASWPRTRRRSSGAIPARRRRCRGWSIAPILRATPGFTRTEGALPPSLVPSSHAATSGSRGIVRQGAKDRGLGTRDRRERARSMRGTGRGARALVCRRAATPRQRAPPARGFSLVRRFWEMAIELDAEPSCPSCRRRSRSNAFASRQRARRSTKR